MMEAGEAYSPCMIHAGTEEGSVDLRRLSMSSWSTGWSK